MPMKKYLPAKILLTAALAISASTAAANQALRIEVAKTPTCGCCTAWIEHLQNNGFEVAAYDVSREQLNQTKAGLGIGPGLASCHTAVIGDYFIEGHVPASDIRQLLATTPDARGLTVPGMPIGSPGMEMGNQRDPYATLIVESKEQTRIFNRHNQ